MLLIRHGRTTANKAGVLAGWSDGIALDDAGRQQAQDLAARLKDVPITHIVASPLQRTVETAKYLTAGRSLKLRKDRNVGEMHYGDWTGKPLKKLSKDPLWPAVQAHPSSVTFPGGESMAAGQTRAVAAVRSWVATAQAEAGDQAVVAIVSHGDIIKAVLADALGMHLDLFQRIVVDPASLSVISYTALRPFVERVNDCGSSVAALIPAPPAAHGGKAAASSDAAVGGGAGPSAGR